MQYVLTWKSVLNLADWRHIQTGAATEKGVDLPAVHSELRCFGQLLDTAERRCGQACNRWDRVRQLSCNFHHEIAIAWAPTLLLPLLLAPSSRPALHRRAAALWSTRHHLLM